ncbi:MAG: 16S rRNA (guanine(527)-N(7))-methyltransferase RsmG [Salinicola sp.]|uniref:16S rRNA (guanine(527)-N(7))-methyltransferase RsmG n=1 Tax=uncultured Salinicola sp. TaxID=1193542 RepID=UPI000C8ABA49|nr:16S rRNA (guanine(527)-N(7))-methyltransferase RsmG [uncultured Salinicola sp.]MAM57247.1 16S rRNA (guanine(527)-N(7))-methyltransferase RsmG [Salinicola sp.]
MTPACERLLDEGLAALGIATERGQRQRLLSLLSLLHKWNRAYNLTAVRSPEAMVGRHLLDSASVAFAVGGTNLLDVGSGPGFPGLVLAILDPGLQVTLLDSNGKKVRFQRQAVMELGLDNVRCEQVRVESFDATFDQVISRAFAALGDFIGLTEPLLARGGEWLAMKGSLEPRELESLPPHVVVRERLALAVPGVDDAERQLLRLGRNEDSDHRQ